MKKPLPTTTIIDRKIHGTLLDFVVRETNVVLDEIDILAEKLEALRIKRDQLDVFYKELTKGQ